MSNGFGNQPPQDRSNPDFHVSGSLKDLLQQLAAGQSLTAAARSRLVTIMLSDEMGYQAFNITSDQAEFAVEERSRLLQAIYPTFSHIFANRFGRSNEALETLWRLWLPLAMQLANCRKTLGRPLIQGILGGQGTGKTTLAAVLTMILGEMGYRVCSISLDDLYKTYADRQQLQQSDPRLRWRGPPGTHDVDLGLDVLQQLRAASSQPVQIPRFDKSAWGGAGDRTTPETVTNIDVVLFEGWFVGARPIDPAAFDTAPEPIISDADREFARDSNTRLADYLPLWQQLDRLIVLHPADYRYSKQWRQQAEHQMIASGRSGMTDEEISEFVTYFWRSLHPELFIKPLLNSSIYTDLVVEINADHTPGNIYSPKH